MASGKDSKEQKWQVLPLATRRMLGSPLRWSNEEIAYFATLQPSEVERILAQFNRDSDYPGIIGGDDDRRYIMLFAAAGAGAGAAWYYARLRADGKPGSGISWKRIRFDMDNKIIRNSKRRMGRLTERLIRGDMSLEEWQTATMREVKYIHSAGAFLADGGPENIGIEAQAILQERLTEEIGYLNRFADQIATGKQPLNRRAVNRAKMYSDAGRGTYERVRRHNASRAGFDEERRVLGQADHCDCCIIEAEKGWKPLGTLKDIGDCTCLTNCHCTFSYRNSKTGERLL